MLVSPFKPWRILESCPRYGYRLHAGNDLLYPGGMEPSPDELSVRCAESRYDAIAVLDLCHSVGLHWVRRNYTLDPYRQTVLDQLPYSPTFVRSSKPKSSNMPASGVDRRVVPARSLVMREFLTASVRLGWSSTPLMIVSMKNAYLMELRCNGAYISEESESVTRFLNHHPLSPSPTVFVPVSVQELFFPSLTYTIHTTLADRPLPYPYAI